MAQKVFAGPVVDRSMAAEFEDAGVSIVGVMPHSLPSISSTAAIALDVAEDIRGSLSSAELCLMWDARQGAKLLKQWCNRLRADYVVVDWRQNEAEHVMPVVEELNARVILIGTALDYDEDPAWAEDQIQRLVSKWDPSGIVLTVLPSVEGWPVKWLCSEAGRYEEDLVLGDIQRLLRTYPLLVNMRLEGSIDLSWVRENLSSALGLAFFLDGQQNDGGSPVMSDSYCVLEVLRGL